jgi:hypothetical protein
MWTEELHNEELNNLYFLPNIIRMINLRSMKRVGHVTHIRQVRSMYEILVRETLRDCLRDLCIHVRIILGDIKEIGCVCVDWIHLA